MALATRCPQCQAMFRVVADQLKLRGGLVRCGSCRHAFDAIGSLSYLDDGAARRASTDPASTDLASADEAAAADLPTAVSAPSATPPAALGPASGGADQSAWGVPTLLIVDPPSPPRAPTDKSRETTQRDQAQADAADTDTPAHSSGAAFGVGPERSPPGPAAAAAPWPAQPQADAPTDERADDESPAFLRRKPRSRSVTICLGAGSVVLAIAALLQLAVLFRVELSIALPAARPVLVKLCKPLHCTVGWPTQAELLAVVGTELQALPGTDVLELTAVVRSRAAYTLALPAVEVTLTDAQSRTLARKVFAPEDYLASAGAAPSRIAEGLAAGADLIVRLSFEARGLAATGFVVYPFYP